MTRIEEHDNCTLIAEFQLKNLHRIYECHAGYRCVGIDRNGIEHTDKIPNDIVDSAHEVLQGGEWNVNTATAALESLAETDNWKFYYGYRLGFYVQDILLVIAAKDDGEFHRSGRGYTYIVY